MKSAYSRNHEELDLANRLSTTYEHLVVVANALFTALMKLDTNVHSTASNVNEHPALIYFKILHLPSDEYKFTTISEHRVHNDIRRL